MSDPIDKAIADRLDQKARDLEELLAAALRLGYAWIEVPREPHEPPGSVRYDLGSWPRFKRRVVGDLH